MNKWLFLVIFIGLLVLVLAAILFLYVKELPRYFLLINSTDIHMKLEESYQRKPRAYIDRVVISFSTIPERIGLLMPTIHSLLDQSVQVDEIQINVPYVSRKGTPYNIPPVLENMRYVKVYRVDEDQGPATKLLPTLLREKDLRNRNGISEKTLIIVVDDDQIYPSDIIEKLTKAYRKNGGHCAVTTFGVNLSRKGEIANGVEKTRAFLAPNPREADILFGFGGFIVDDDMFPDEVHDLKGPDIPKECVSVDDNWFSGWLRYNRVKIMTLGATYINWPLINRGKMKNTPALSVNENKEYIPEKITVKWFMEQKGVRPVKEYHLMINQESNLIADNWKSIVFFLFLFFFTVAIYFGFFYRESRRRSSRLKN